MLWRTIILFLDKMVWKPFYCRMNILLSLRRQEQYYRLFLGGFAAMPLTSGIIKRLIRFIRNKYKNGFISRFYRFADFIHCVFSTEYLYTRWKGARFLRQNRKNPCTWTTHNSPESLGFQGHLRCSVHIMYHSKLWWVSRPSLPQSLRDSSLPEGASCR